MKSHQILAAMPPALANDVLEFAFSADKKLYHAALEAVAPAYLTPAATRSRYSGLRAQGGR